MPPLLSKEELARRVKAAYRLADTASYSSSFEYLRRVVINCKPSPRRFVSVARNWQIAINQHVLPAIESVAGLRHDYFGPTCFWFTLPRGHDKTGMIGRVVNWALAYTRVNLSCLAASGTREQAGILLRSMQTEADLNPWLKERLSFKHNFVEGQQGSYIKVLSSDGNSTFGYTPDLMVLDELTHWESQDLWTAVASSKEKRPGSVLMIITNAGTKKSWQERILEEVRGFPDWFVYEAPDHLDTWMDIDAIGRLERLLPSTEARRLFHNEWINPGEKCGLCEEADVEACAMLGRSRQLTYRTECLDRQREHIVSIDYGPVKDRTVICVLHQSDDGTLVVDQMVVFQGKDFPGHRRRVPIELVERTITEIREKFRIGLLVVDPYQMEGTIQRFTGQVPLETFESRAGKANYELATNLRALLVNQQICWYPGCGEIIHNGQTHDLEDELTEVLIRQMGYGFRIDHESGRHDDRVIALGMAALHAVQRGKRVGIPDDLTPYF